jgi:hypothetical protein
MHVARGAAERAFREAGFAVEGLVINAVVSDGEYMLAVGSAVPADAPEDRRELLALSLRESAGELGLDESQVSP